MVTSNNDSQSAREPSASAERVAPLRVFISSPFHDLKEYREATLRAVLALGTFAEDMVFWSADEREVTAQSTDRVRSCDVFLLLLAHRYGTVRPGSSRSITELEFEAARAANRPILAFFVDESFPWPVDDIDNDASRKELARFKNVVAQHASPVKFRSPDDLRALVTGALAKLLQRQGRLGDGQGPGIRLRSLDVRTAEVRELISRDDSVHAAVRLLDLARDLAAPARISDEIYELKRRLHRLRGASPFSSGELDAINDALLAVLTELEQHASGEDQRRTRPGDWSSEDAVLRDARARAKAAARQGAHRPTAAASSLAGSPTAAEAPPPTVGASIADRLDLPSARQLAPVVRCKDLTFQYRQSPTPFALRGVSLEMRAGEIMGVVGENGNGKTTLLQLLAGELAPSAGTLEFPWLASGARPDWFAVKQRIAFVPHSLLKWGDTPLDAGLRFVAAAYGRSGDANTRAVDWIVNRLGLEEYREAKWGQLSAGYRARSALGAALLTFPRLLLLDEPLANLDLNAQVRFMQDLRNLADSRAEPLCVILTSQHLHQVEAVADQMLVLRAGAPVFCGPRDDLGNEREVNTFELEADQSAKEAVDVLLSAYPLVAPITNGSVVTFRLPLSVSAHDVLTTLLRANVRVVYFRDISKSSRTVLTEVR